MLRNIFLWFYCLPIKDATVLAIFVSAAYLVLRQYLGKKRFWQIIITLLLLAWIVVIAIATLADRVSSDIALIPHLIPFHSYRAVIAGENKEILRSNFMNVLLFYPAGLLACELLPKGWSRIRKTVVITVLVALASTGIEFCQYYYALGQAEVDDVIHNALGALIGALICTVQLKCKLHKNKD